MKRKNFAPILILAIVIVLAGISYFGFKNLYTQPSAPQTIIDTTNWKTYTNTKYGFQIKYYPESTPYELTGNTEPGQFVYLYQVNFGTNPLTSIYGYSLAVTQKQTTENYRTELVGHITDKIDSEKDITIDGNTWKKINYQMFLTTDYVPMTMAYINRSEYDFIITASSQDTDQILSTFKFKN